MSEAGAADGHSIAVTIPTRSRPDTLARCLASLAPARSRHEFTAYVCDSSPDASDRAAVARVCAAHEWVSLSTHEGRNPAAARNACVAAAHEDLLITVDDDLELEPEAISRLLDAYREGEGRRVVSGSVSWGEGWTEPMKMGMIGYGRPLRDGEQPDFVASPLLLYPREFGLAWPWNERIDESEDIFACVLWRSKGVRIRFAAGARALHPAPPASADQAGRFIDHQCWHVYVLLYEALLAERSPLRLLSYETLGFLASAKLYVRRPRWLARFLANWARGHLRFLRDLRFLRSLGRREASA